MSQSWAGKGPPPPGTHLLEMVGISKTFGEVRALCGVDFHIGQNESVGLLGDNGAGKSTLIKIITGYHHPDPGGEIYFRGQRVDHLTVSKARELGIETVYQEKALADKQTLWRNIFMGREIGGWSGLLDIPRMREETRRLMVEKMGFTSAAIGPETLVRTMSGGERQGVAIVRALYFQAELIILDEPTMGLSVSETQKTLDFVRGIKDAGKSSLFIDHNIFHVYPVVDRIVILDRGRVAGEFLRDRITLDELTHRLRQVARTGTLDGTPAA